MNESAPHTPGFAILPAGLLAIWSDLPAHWQNLLPYIAKRMPECFVKQAELASEAQRSRVQVCKTIKQMVAAGLLIDDGSQGRRTRTYSWPNFDDADVLTKIGSSVPLRRTLVPPTEVSEVFLQGEHQVFVQKEHQVFAQGEHQVFVLGATRIEETTEQPLEQTLDENSRDRVNIPDGQAPPAGSQAGQPAATPASSPPAPAGMPAIGPGVPRPPASPSPAMTPPLAPIALPPHKPPLIPSAWPIAAVAPSASPPTRVVTGPPVAPSPNATPPEPLKRSSRRRLTDETRDRIRSSLPAMTAWLAIGQDAVGESSARWREWEPSVTCWFRLDQVGGKDGVDPADLLVADPTRQQVAGLGWYVLSALRAAAGQHITLPGSGELLGAKKTRGYLDELFNSLGVAETAQHILRVYRGWDDIAARLANLPNPIALSPNVFRHKLVLREADAMTTQPEYAQ